MTVATTVCLCRWPLRHSENETDVRTCLEEILRVLGGHGGDVGDTDVAVALF